MAQTINLGLDNPELYRGCEIEKVAGRANLTTSVVSAIEIVGENIAAMAISTRKR
ncbi:MAG: hypothetical protein P4L62_02790 [Candidatus Pacebacteria bacterium]|nr:hypothetical protein [Candidatus Paceibacterota bacterium]MDR3583260.1 hypothetical protein [Candidatus Paceibacterota bacterium]